MFYNTRQFLDARAQQLIIAFLSLTSQFTPETPRAAESQRISHWLQSSKICVRTRGSNARTDCRLKMLATRLRLASNQNHSPINARYLAYILTCVESLIPCVENIRDLSFECLIKVCFDEST